MGPDDFDTAFRESYARLVALGSAMSGDRELARDLAQETMLRAHARWEQIVTLDNPHAWMRRVMTNLVIDQHRRQSRERVALTRISGRPGATDTAEQRGLDLLWTALVDSLPIRQRAVVVLHYGEDLSIDDVADVLDISPGTVKSTLSKARHKLRHEMEHGVQRD